MKWGFASGAFSRAEMLALLLLLVGFPQVSAQVPSPETLEQKRRGDISDFKAPVLKFRQSSETGAVEPVQRAPAPDMFTLYTSQSYYHTDNLFLTAPNPQSANAWVGALGISFVPYSTYRWTPRFSVITCCPGISTCRPVALKVSAAVWVSSTSGWRWSTI